MKLLSIVGKKRSGKDTAAQFISELYPCHTVALADKIKELLSDAYNTLELKNSTFVDLTLDDFYDLGGYDRELTLHLSNRDVTELFSYAFSMLKREYPNIPGIADHEIEQVILKKKEPWSIRTLMQTFGTDIVVNLSCKTIWVNIVIDKYIKLHGESITDGYFIITDVRQGHELDILTALGALSIFLKGRDIIESSSDKHSTEAGLNPRPNDIVIQNNGTLDDLKSNLKKALS